MRRIFSKFPYNLLVPAMVVVSLLIGGGPLLPFQAQASLLQQRSLKLNNATPDEIGDYQFSLEIATAGTLGSLKVEVCSNSSILYDVCTPPVGFDLSAANLIDQTGETGFSIGPGTTTNTLILSRVPVPTSGGLMSFTLSNVHNPSSEGSYYARYYTHASDDASGPVVDDGALAYSINKPYGVSAEVPPYLLLCVAQNILGVDCSSANGNFVQLGDLSAARVSSGQTQIVVATNAPNGYTIRINGQTMTSGNNFIPALTSPTASAPGTSQFGINLRQNGDPNDGEEPSGSGSGDPVAGYNQPNAFKFVPGEVIASGNSAEDYRKYTSTYMVNISRAQAAGVYSGTFSYIALGNF